MLRKGYTPIIREFPVEIETYHIPVELYLQKDEKGANKFQPHLQEENQLEQLNQ